MFNCFPVSSVYSVYAYVSILGAQDTMVARTDQILYVEESHFSEEHQRNKSIRVLLSKLCVRVCVLRNKLSHEE